MNAFAQNGGGTMGSGTTGGSVASVYNFHSNYLIGFDSPEGWGFKYFASTTLINGLQPAESEGYRVGSVTRPRALASHMIRPACVMPAGNFKLLARFAACRS